MKYDLCVIGGAGHVGLPFGVAFANKRVKTVLFDVNKEWLGKIREGTFPFKEKGGEEALRQALKKNTLFTSDKPSVIRQSRFLLLVIGTPVDEYLNPDLNGLMRLFDNYLPYFKKGHIIILRSTVYPGTTERIQRYFWDHGKKVHVVFCPERIVQGQAMEELQKLPQIVSGFDQDAVSRVSTFFRKVAPQVILAERPVEAELAKLFSNSWRYIQFAVANQFYMIAEEHNLDYRKIYEAVTKEYPRMKDLPKPGFTAGPCLFKDTMQLAAFNNNTFFLGHAAMLVNEGLPNFIMKRLKYKFLRPAAPAADGKPVARFASVAPFDDMMGAMRAHNDLKHKTVGILGMAFKANSDDPRDSLAYKLRKIARAEAHAVLCHDSYIKDPSFHPLEKVLSESDIVILAAPHKEYRKINPAQYPKKLFVDIWNFWS